MVKEKNIPVLDQNNCFLSNTTSAKARILLKEKRAMVFNKTPFMIKLTGEGERKMKSNATFNLRKFLQENEEVYVRNLSNTQISLSVPIGDGFSDGVLIPRAVRPICLTRIYDSKSLLMSQDLRKLFYRKPPILELLTYEEYIEYHEKRAKSNNTTVEEELEKSLELDNRMMNKETEDMKTSRGVEKPKPPIDFKIDGLDEGETEVVVRYHPKVQGLLVEVSPEIKKSEKMKAGDFIEELEMLESELSKDDLSLIHSEGYWKTVKEWARVRLEKLVDSEE